MVDAKGAELTHAETVTLLPVFRILAGLGRFRWFVDRRRLVTTLLTNLHGLVLPVTFRGAVVTEMTPVTSMTGNVTLSVAALS